MGLTRHEHELWFGKERWERTGDPHGINGPWVDRDPYKTLYAYFHRTLRRAKVVVVIGYSFHDKHVNQEVTKAARHAQIVVLDPGVLHYNRSGDATHKHPPFEWLQFSDEDTDWSRFHWLDKKFGQPETTHVLLEEIESLLNRRSRRRK